MKKRLLSAGLSLCMLLSCIPCLSLLSANALAADSNKTIQLGTTVLKDPAALGNRYYRPSSYIYFGVDEYDDNEPIKWRVLDADKANDGKTDAIFLLSEYLLSQSVPFNMTQAEGNNWQGSNAQKWCSSFAGNISNFAPAEQAAMLGVAKTEEKGYREVTKGTTFYWNKCSLTEDDKMFFLSVAEVCDYVACNASEAFASAVDTKNKEDSWWFRTPAYFTESVSLNGKWVYMLAMKGFMSSDVVSSAHKARPAVNLNPDSVLLTSAAEYVTGDGKLTEVPSYRGNEWKLTLLDESRSGFTASTTAINNNILTVEYKNAQTGSNEYISAIVTDAGGNVSHYGRIAKLDGKTHRESGTVKIDLSGIDMDGKTISVFNEQYNGTRMTDYASNFREVNIPAVTTYTITVDTDGNGTAKASAERAQEGDTVTLTATPNEGYHFKEWAGNVEITDNTFTMGAENVTIKATFEKDAEPEEPKPETKPVDQVFSDVKTTDWFHPEIQYVYDNGLMNGTSAATFEPNTVLTRSMMMTILWRMDGKPAPSKASNFTDVKAGEWYADAVAWAQEQNITNGMGDGTFGTFDSITREQMVTMFQRYAQYKGYDTAASKDLSAYSDAGSVSSYAQASMQWAVGCGLMNGRTATTLEPKGTATRAEAATIMHRFDTIVKK